jgi:hypothetical protein
MSQNCARPILNALGFGAGAKDPNIDRHAIKVKTLK